MPLLLFQIVAVVAIAVAAFFLFRGGGAKQQALRRIAAVLFVLVAAFSLFFPQYWTLVANFLGIGRGADLLLYLLVLFFFGYVASSYRKFRVQERQITELSRQIALLNSQVESAEEDPRD